MARQLSLRWALVALCAISLAASVQVSTNLIQTYALATQL